MYFITSKHRVYRRWSLQAPGSQRHARKASLRAAWLPLLMLLLVSSLTACDSTIYDYDTCPPEPEPPRPTFTLRLEFDRALPDYKEVFYSQSRSWRGEGFVPDLRYTVRVFAEDRSDREALMSYTFTQPGWAPESIDVPLELPDGNYRFAVWADYVKPGETVDLHYTTEDWSDIHVSRENYSGCDDTRDAFRGESEEVCYIPDQTLHTVRMERPLAKYQFISTDFDLFLQQRGYTAAPSFDPAEIVASPSFNPDDYYIMMRYTGFVPSSFSNFTNRPTDAMLGLSYRGDIVYLGGNDALISFDYVFVNGAQTEVDVAIDIYNRKGELLATTPSMAVPLKRSMLTTVRGQFLTSSSSGSVGIDPSFEGSYDIVFE